MSSLLPYKDKLFKESFNFTDGEAIYNVSIHGVINLLLPGEHPRNIGFLAKSENGVDYYVTRNPEIHLFQKMNAYGVNHKVMEIFTPDNIVMYLVNKSSGKVDMRIIDRATYIQHSKFLHFKKQNFELQRFIGVEHLKKFNEGKTEAKKSLI